MSDAPESPSAANEIQINVKGPSELKLQISISPDKSVLELKQAIASKSDVEADRQRLIYSGRVLKDEDVLTTYKIQTNHTIHMVKGAARAANTGSTSTSSTSTSTGAPAQQLPTMQSGQNPHDPLTLLNGHMGHGVMAGFNPFAEMGVNPNDPNMLQGMMDSPQFLQQMSSVMSNPQVLDQLMAANPQLSAMGPQLRQMFQSERFRELVSNPDSLRTLLQMSSMMQGQGGAGPFGSAPPAFPAPGLPTDGTGPPPSTTSSSTTPGSPPAAGAAGVPPINPFNLFGGLGAGAGAGGAGAGAGAAGANPLLNPEMMQQMQQLLGGGGPFGGGAGAGAGGFGGMGGFGGLGGFGGMGAGGAGSPPAAPADARPAEERFQVQLQQLQDMGFTNAAQNVRALLATAGNVHAAIEYILGGGGLN